MRKLNINHPSDGSPGSEAGEVGGGPRPDARARPRDQDDLASQGAAGGHGWGHCGHAGCSLLTGLEENTTSTLTLNSEHVL